MGDLEEDLLEAGKIAAKIRCTLHDVVYSGKSVLEICEEIEHEIKRLGGSPAFPCNVGINEIAAHYTSNPDDTLTIPTEGLVKVDFGVHVNGYIADTAVSISLSSDYSVMVQAIEDALAMAVKSLQPGVKVSEIGRKIEDTIKGWGYQPIKNLMGHKLERFVLHSGKSIPNVSTFNGARIRKGEVYAVEPFLTTSNGAGSVVEADQGAIYRLHKEKKLITKQAKELISIIRAKFYTLPFSFRWLRHEMELSTLTTAFQELLRNGCLIVYPILIEKMGAPVAQAEHTILITDNGCKILTQ